MPRKPFMSTIPSGTGRGVPTGCGPASAPGDMREGLNGQGEEGQLVLPLDLSPIHLPENGGHVRMTSVEAPGSSQLGAPCLSGAPSFHANPAELLASNLCQDSINEANGTEALHRFTSSGLDWLADQGLQGQDADVTQGGFVWHEVHVIKTNSTPNGR